MQHPSEAPPKHFLKVILPSPIHDKQLRIPEEFISRFGNELSSFATVTVPDGRTWKMGLKKCGGGGGGGDVYFCNNWQEFAKYYSIRYGSYLVFKYEGNSNFTVVIIDSTSAEISYPCNNIETTSNSTASERAKAAAHEFKIDNPFFVSTIKNSRVYIPLEFAPKYLKPDAHVELQNSTSTSNGQKWKACCVCHDPRSSAMRMVKGFAKFMSDNDLSDGDTCVFELIKRDHPAVLLQVTSFRASDYAN